MERLIFFAIDVNWDSVIIFGVRVPRPVGVSVGDWMKLWNRIKNGQDQHLPWD